MVDDARHLFSDDIFDAQLLRVDDLSAGLPPRCFVYTSTSIPKIVVP